MFIGDREVYGDLKQALKDVQERHHRQMRKTVFSR